MVPGLEVGLAGYISSYNTGRPHQGLGYRAPAEYTLAVERPFRLVNHPPAIRRIVVQ